MITDLTAIKVAAANHFAQFLNPNVAPFHFGTAPILSELIDFRCPSHTAELLTHPLSEAEIKNVLFSMPSNKASGPDGYPVGFYRAAWNIIGRDFILAVQTFFLNGFLPKGVNATILALVPKTPGAETLKEY